MLTYFHIYLILISHGMYTHLRTLNTTLLICTQIRDQNSVHIGKLKLIHRIKES